MNEIDRIAIIFNQFKSRKRLQRYVEAVHAQKPGMIIDIFPTENLADGRNQAQKAANSGYALIVSAGGDGTLLGVVNGVLGTDTPVTPLPFGNGNDTAKALGILSLDDAVNALLHGTVRQVDAGRCTYHDETGAAQQMCFCSTAGLGLFADMFLLERRLSMPVVKKILGDMIWPVFTLVALLRSRNIDTQLSFDSHACHARLRLLEVSKVKQAGGWPFTPQARLDNGMLDAWMVHRINRLQAIGLTLRIVLNDLGLASPGRYDYFSSQPHTNSFGFHHTTSIEVSPEQPLALHAHGEPLGYSPALFELVPKSLNILSCPGED